MKSLNVSIDVGGTHSRLQCELVENKKVISTSGEYKKVIGNKTSLGKFVQTSIRDFTDLAPAKCIIGFAGPVIDRQEVAITNWTNRPKITQDDLIDWGLPENTFMVNDMELASYGLLDMKEQKQIPSEFCKTLYMPENLSDKYPENMLVIAPGTGFGTGSIVEVKTKSGEKIYEIVSSEIQHIQIPPLDETHEKMIQIIFGKKENRNFLNFEDFVSGQGLEDTYNALLRLNGKKPNGKSAAKIAQSAVENSDEIAAKSLDYFYRITGRLTQAMSLMLQPYGGVFLCGASTEKNADFIKESGFLFEMHNCLVRKLLLEQYPVFIITKSDINLAGGLWACRNII
ncbi:MAG: glucokinase [Candidatus Cloacimonadales bacterium]|nr:glucokinase [Candidatus Cloacimonadales bacterium]